MTLKIFSEAKADRSVFHVLAIAYFDRGKSEFAGNRTEASKIGSDSTCSVVA